MYYLFWMIFLVCSTTPSRQRSLTSLMEVPAAVSTDPPHCQSTVYSWSCSSPLEVWSSQSGDICNRKQNSGKIEEAAKKSLCSWSNLRRGPLSKTFYPMTNQNKMLSKKYKVFNFLTGEMKKNMLRHWFADMIIITLRNSRRNSKAYFSSKCISLISDMLWPLWPSANTVQHSSTQFLTWQNVQLHGNATLKKMNVDVCNIAPFRMKRFLPSPSFNSLGMIWTRRKSTCDGDVKQQRRYTSVYSLLSLLTCTWVLWWARSASVRAPVWLWRVRQWRLSPLPSPTAVWRTTVGIEDAGISEMTLLLPVRLKLHWRRCWWYKTHTHTQRLSFRKNQK